jgi:poly-gamma-glutamate hydrolase-like protein
MQPREYSAKNSASLFSAGWELSLFELELQPGGRGAAGRAGLVEDDATTCRRPPSSLGTGSSTATAKCNIVNRTLLGNGGQLELSTPLRQAMFTEESRSRRKHTTTQLFWDLRGGVPRRAPPARSRAGQFPPGLQCLEPELRCRAT